MQAIQTLQRLSTADDLLLDDDPERPWQPRLAAVAQVDQPELLEHMRPRPDSEEADAD